MSLKHFFKHRLPHHDHIKQWASMHLLSDYLHEPNIWHIHRRSAAGGAAVGMFCAFIPAPIQTIASATLAILFRVNLPLAIVFSLFSNPITIPPLFYFSYHVGSKILTIKEKQVEFTFTLDWISNTLVHIWEPLLLGCFIVGSISSLITYFGIRLIWWISVVHKWGKRRHPKQKN